MTILTVGPFTCDVTLRVVRAPTFGREERGGVTYLVGRDYELAYETILHFADGEELSIKATLIGELNQQVGHPRFARNACPREWLCAGADGD